MPTGPECALFSGMKRRPTRKPAGRSPHAPDVNDLPATIRRSVEQIAAWIQSLSYETSYTLLWLTPLPSGRTKTHRERWRS